MNLLLGRGRVPLHVVGFKGLHRITTAQLVLLVYKVAAVFNKVNAAKSRVTTTVRVSTAGWIKWLEDQDMRIQALVDKQKVIIMEESIRCDLQFDDAEGMVKHKEIYVKSSHTKKVFANMRRKGQGFSGTVTPLFKIMMINAQEDVGKGSGIHTDSHHTPTNTQPSSSKSQKKIKPKRNQRQAAKVHSPSSENRVKKSIPTLSNDPLPSAKIAQAKEIAKLKKRVKKLKKRRKSRPARLRRLKKVGSRKQVESSEEKDSLGAQKDASKQGRSIEDIDQDAKIALVDKYQGMMHDADMFGVDDLEGNEVIVDVREKIVEKKVNTADPVTTAGEVVTAASAEDSAAPTTTTIADVDDELTLEKTLITIKAAKPKVILNAITTPRAKGIVFHKQVQAHIPTVSSLKDKGKAKMIEPEKPLEKKDQISLDEEVARMLEAKMRAKMKEEERIAREKDETTRAKSKQELKKESAKKQKLAEQEQAKVADDDTAELKRSLEIVLEDDDDVAIEATPLSSKSSTIVDYKIYREGKTSYFKIIRADGNSQNYLTFETMFKNFNKEDLEVLRSIVKEKFKKTKPVDYMENLLFQTLKTMFEPHVEDIIWKYQQGAVDYKVEMAYDLLRLIRRQINEGYKPE
nr:hypothetical protein [Tanacetum cinerariifolium]